MLPHLPPDAAKALREALLRVRYTTDGVRDLLGAGAHAALGRGEPEPAFLATADAGELGVLVRLLLLGAVESDAAVAAALAPLAPADAAAAGLLAASGTGGWRAALDLRPYGVADEPDWWVLSDLDARRQQRDHVTGVGAASVTLAAATVRRPVGSLLDLGTGCGVQALHGTRHARRVTGTDVAPRALALARATFARQRPRRRAARRAVAASRWRAAASTRSCPTRRSCPVRPGSTSSTATRAQDGDAALAALVGDLAGHLEPGGVAQLLGSWLHVRGQDWPDRVRAWLPADCDAWVVQREVADPALHVGTWQRDAGLDPAVPGRPGAGARVAELDGVRTGRGGRVRDDHPAPHRRGTDRGVRGPGRAVRRPARAGGRGLAGPRRLAARPRRRRRPARAHG